MTTHPFFLLAIVAIMMLVLIPLIAVLLYTRQMTELLSAPGANTEPAIIVAAIYFYPHPNLPGWNMAEIIQANEVSYLFFRSGQQSSKQSKLLTFTEYWAETQSYKGHENIDRAIESWRRFCGLYVCPNPVNRVEIPGSIIERIKTSAL